MKELKKCSPDGGWTPRQTVQLIVAYNAALTLEDITDRHKLGK
jgi:hypothetical protein